MGGWGGWKSMEGNGMKGREHGHSTYLVWGFGGRREKYGSTGALCWGNEREGGQCTVMVLVGTRRVGSAVEIP